MISWRGICWDICLTFKLCVHTPRRSIFINIWTWFMTRGQNGKIYSLTRRLGFARYTTCALTPSHLALCNIYNTQMYKMYKIYSHPKVGTCSTPKLCFHPSPPCSPQHNQSERPAPKTGSLFDYLICIFFLLLFLHLLSPWVNIV